MLGLCGVWWLCLAGRLDVTETSLATLSLMILGDRAFAPQYLIWIMPLWALFPLRRSWVLAAVLTTLAYPFTLGLSLRFKVTLAPAVVVGALRNLVLVVGTASWLRARLIGDSRTGLAASAPAFAEQDAVSSSVIDSRGPQPIPVSGGEPSLLDVR